LSRPASLISLRTPSPGKRLADGPLPGLSGPESVRMSSLS
jgi:hypothetical protein